MIAMPSFASDSGQSRSALHADFLRILPDVEQHAHGYFRHLGAEAREEAVAQATALAFATFRRLQARGKDPLAFAGKLARLSARQVQAGRSLGNHQSSTDILSRATQRRWGFRVQSLTRQRAADAEAWQEAVVETTRRPHRPMRPPFGSISPSGWLPYRPATASWWTCWRCPIRPRMPPVN